jgi:hypothetical protein
VNDITPHPTETGNSQQRWWGAGIGGILINRSTEVDPPTESDLSERREVAEFMRDKLS